MAVHPIFPLLKWQLVVSIWWVPWNDWLGLVDTIILKCCCVTVMMLTQMKTC